MRLNARVLVPGCGWHCREGSAQDPGAGAWALAASIPVLGVDPATAKGSAQESQQHMQCPAPPRGAAGSGTTW